MAELVWEGKYDVNGNRIAPLKVPLPFQTVETVNESAQERQKSLDLFSSGRDPEWRNRLIWGDKKYVLPALSEEFAGKVDLVYIDPPFATGDDFSLVVDVPDDEESLEDGVSFVKEPSVIERKAYRDTWGVSRADRERGVSSLDRYIRWFYETSVCLHELLSDKGSLYVHLDWRVGHYAKLVLDEVFGSKNFRNDITWWYRKWSKSSKHYLRNHDVLLFYSKTDRHTFNILRVPLADTTVKRFGGKRQDFADETRTRKITTEEESEGGFRPDVWTHNAIPAHAAERVPFPTQKPSSLLETVIQASSNEGDLVMDCFVGSGTTAVVAEKLGRRWIACDLSRFAIHTTRKRLLQIPGIHPLAVQNLGKYERQLWQQREFGDEAEERVLAYRRFILDLYKAKAIQGYAWLHGVKAGAMVHVGTVDAPITTGDIKQIALEFRKAVGKGKDAPKTAAVDVLGWDFAFELNEVAKQEAALANITMRFVRIPREVLDRRAVEQGDVHFYELAALGVAFKTNKRTVTLRITDFVIPLDDVPDDVQRAVKNWNQWIDYCAVDWDNRDDTFHNEWQTYRTKDTPKLELAASHEYNSPGKYRVVVKVVDILGNDTTKSTEVEVK